MSRGKCISQATEGNSFPLVSGHTVPRLQPKGITSSLASSLPPLPAALHLQCSVQETGCNPAAGTQEVPVPLQTSSREGLMFPQCLLLSSPHSTGKPSAFTKFSLLSITGCGIQLTQEHCLVPPASLGPPKILFL